LRAREVHVQRLSADPRTNSRGVIGPDEHGGTLVVHSYASRRRRVGVVAIVVAMALLAAACGGSDKKTGPTNTVPEDEGTAKRGGELVYGLEAETLGGWCMPSAQLAAGGIQVASAFFDTLTYPNDKGEYVPYLAESIEPNADYTEWTVKLRPGIKFHNGEPFNAAVVKRNLDTFRQGILFSLALADIKEVQAVDDLTVKIVNRIPWVAIPAWLWATGRLGMIANEQLDLSAQECPRKLIGTGPFKFVEWRPNDKLVGERNPNYWQKDENGVQLPYLDRITFRPVPDVVQRVNGLKGGDLDLIHLTDGEQISLLRRDASSNSVKLLESTRAAEVAHVMLHAGKPPFDNLNARLAVAYAANPEEANATNQRGVNKLAIQPFAPETLGYTADAEFPKFNLARARQYAAAYKRDTGQDLSFVIEHTNDQATKDLALIVQSQMKAAGINASLPQTGTEQSQYINRAISGDYQAILWRNFPGGDPDTLYIWWHSKIWDPATNSFSRVNLVNFGRINDPEIDAALEAGRSEPDPEKRKAEYQKIGKEFADGVYNVWTWYATWGFASKNDVNGVVGPKLPNGDERGLPIASVQPVLGLWRG
jgi:peptide/nickel transport system substrate-binding protein